LGQTKEGSRKVQRRVRILEYSAKKKGGGLHIIIRKKTSHRRKDSKGPPVRGDPLLGDIAREKEGRGIG